MFSARQYVQQLSTYAVWELGRHRGLSYLGVVDASARSQLADRLLDRKLLAEQLGELSPVEKAILDDVRRNGGTGSVRDIGRGLEQEGLHSGGRDDVYDLLGRGLLFYTESTMACADARRGVDLAPSQVFRGKPDPEICLPPEVQALMWPLPPPAPPLPEEPPAHLEEYQGSLTPVHSSVAGTVRDLFAMFQAIRARPLGLRQDGGIRKADLARLNKALAPSGGVSGAERGSSDPRPDFLFDLARPLGLFQKSSDEAFVEALDQGLEFFGLAPVEQAGRLRDAWRNQAFWNELRQASGLFVSSYSSEAPDPKGIVSARTQILDVLKTPDVTCKWISIESLSRVMRREHPEFLFRRRRPRFLRYDLDDLYAMPYQGVYPASWLQTRKGSFDKRRDWDRVEGAFIIAVIAETLSWVGIVETGSDAEGRPVAFRLTPDGAAALGIETAAAPEAAAAPRALTVQPSFEMVLLPEVSGFAAAVELDRFADRVSTDRAMLYRMSRESLYRAFREGLRGEAILATLERLSGMAIPQNVRHSIEDWSARYGSIRLQRRALVLTSDDEGVLDRAITAAKVSGTRRLAPTAALLTGGELIRARLPGEVRCCDYTAAPAKVVRIEDDGRLVVPAKALSPYLRYRLEQLARPAGEGAFTLDRERVAAALRGGMRAPDIERFLAAVATTPLPPRVRLAIRGWSGSYRDLGLAPVAAFTAPPAVLDLLLGIAEFREHLLARPAPTVALVDPAEAGAIRAVLDEFGLTPRDRVELERPASAGPLADAEPVYVLPARDIRTLLERAIAEHREVLLLVVSQEPSRTGYQAWRKATVDLERVTPLELVRSGSRYELKARDADGDTWESSLANIHAIRLLEPE